MTSPRTPDIGIGEKNYEVKKTLGKGVFGEVFLAKDTVTNDLVAIKKFTFNKEAFEKPFHDGLAKALDGMKARIASIENDPEKMDELNKMKKSLASMDDAFVKSKLEAFYKQSGYDKLISDMTNGANHEHKLLSKIGDGIGPLQTNDNAQTFLIAMKLAKGDTLTNVLGVGKNKADTLEPAQLIEITTQLIDQVLSLQQDHGIVMRDLGTNNVMYDTASGTLSIIDHGDSLELENGQAKGQAMGTPPYIAPEVLLKMDARHESVQDVNFNEKTTIFTAGAMIAKFFELAEPIKSSSVQELAERPVMFQTIKIRDADTLKSNISDPEVRADLVSLLKEMTERDPKKRIITLPEVKERIDNIMGNYLQKLQTPELPNQTGSEASANATVQSTVDRTSVAENIHETNPTEPSPTQLKR